MFYEFRRPSQVRVLYDAATLPGAAAAAAHLPGVRVRVGGHLLHAWLSVAGDMVLDASVLLAANAAAAITVLAQSIRAPPAAYRVLLDTWYLHPAPGGENVFRLCTDARPRQVAKGCRPRRKGLPHPSGRREGP